MEGCGRLAMNPGPDDAGPGFMKAYCPAEAAAQGATLRPGRGYMVRPMVPELFVTSVTSTHAVDGVAPQWPRDDVEDVNLVAVLDVVAVGVEVAGDVERRVVHVAALGVVAVAAVLGAQGVNDAIHEFPRAAMFLAGVPQRAGELRGDRADGC